MSSVQFNKSEQYIKNYLYDSYLKTFLYLEIGKKLNMSFDEFLARPRYEIESMIRIVKEIDERRNKTTENIMKNLETKTPKANFNTEGI